ncbi:ASKHA domain-containing protein [Bacteroidota bacterium]
MKHYIKVRFEPVGKEIDVISDTPLTDLVQEYGVDFPCGQKGICGKCKVKILEGDIPLSSFHKRALEKLNLGKEWRLACLSAVKTDLVLAVDQWQQVVLDDQTEFPFEPAEGNGIAIDMGTTTLVSQLVDRSTGQVLGVEVGMNPQYRYGADIISRIEFGISTKHHAKKLQLCLWNEVREHIRKLNERSNAPIKKIVMVGNTFIHHAFNGLDLQPLALYPFHSDSTGIQYIDPHQLEPYLPDDSTIVFLPCIGGFVGSDILAGILATGIYKSDVMNLLIDLGTNGEIVVGNKDHIICASTAAGPAFEGTNISMGMKATRGAISSVFQNNMNISFHVIGNEDEKGICGSGLIDIMAVLREMEYMDETGQMTNNASSIQISDKVSVTQKDIREFQLAKAAVAAGSEILLNQLKVSPDDLVNIYIAGAFGNYINLENSRKVGLINYPPEKIIRASNAALRGAKMALFRDEDFILPVLSRIQHFELEKDPCFQDQFANQMFFF